MRRQSDTITNPSSILTTGVLIAVRSFPRNLLFLLYLMLSLVLGQTLLYDLANLFLANGKKFVYNDPGETIQLMFFLQFMRTPSLRCEGAKF